MEKGLWQGGRREKGKEGREREEGKGGQGRAGIGTNGTKHRFKGPQTMWPSEECVWGGTRLRVEGEEGSKGLTVRYLRMSGLQDSEAQ